MSKELTELPNDRTTLRWLIDHRWGHAASLATAQELIDRIVGFSAPSRAGEIYLPHDADGAGPDGPQAAEEVRAEAPGSRLAAFAESDDPPAYLTFLNGDLPPIRDVPWLVAPTQHFPIVGVGFAEAEFRQYLAGLPDAMTWRPRGVTIHHTAAPSLAQRPVGFVEQHMRNLRGYYMGLGWSRGPHLFVDEHRIWVFSPLQNRGVHAVTFNGSHFGVEMLGNYDSEDPSAGRGAGVLRMGKVATALLCHRYGFSPSNVVSPQEVNGHRDCRSTAKTCPGRRVDMGQFRAGVSAKLTQLRA